MNEAVNLIMPMGGSGSRFSKDGFVIPKPLIEIEEKPFFYWATQSIKKFVNLKSLVFVVLEEHVVNFKIDKKIKEYFPDAVIKVIPKVLNGAVLTCLEGVKEITNEAPIIFNDCDHMFKCDSFYHYCNRGEFSEVDGALLTFESTDPKFSYLECNSDGDVIRTVEKVPISNNAICGTYYFKDKKTFTHATEEYLEKCNYTEYFVSGVYNIMAQKGKIIKKFCVDTHLSFGTPEEYSYAVNSNDFEVFK